MEESFQGDLSNGKAKARGCKGKAFETLCRLSGAFIWASIGLLALCVSVILSPLLLLLRIRESERFFNSPD